MYIAKGIRFYFETKFLACDSCCTKAWGINNRPYDKDEIFLLDDILDQAPDDPGTYEGGDAKPRYVEERLNKWCARECERSVLVDHKSTIAPGLKMKNLELTGQQGVVSEELILMIDAKTKQGEQ